MQQIPDSFRTIAAPSEGEFKDRGSKFLAYAYPAVSEEEALERLEALRKEHFKARHHCFAWRFGVDGTRFRANDDGEPSGTAGRPILGQIDAFGLTDVVVVVVRYFGGTLLGASGLIHAYREAAAEALRAAKTEEKIIREQVEIEVEYGLMPELVHALKKLNVEIVRESFSEHCLLEVGIRKNEVDETLLQLRALLWKMPPAEIGSLGWPPGIRDVRCDRPLP